MENSLKGLILAAGVIITCLVIGLGFYLSREAKNTSNSGANQVSGMNGEYQDIDLSLYDGLLVSGKEIIDLMPKCKEKQIFINVKTKACVALYGVWYIHSYDEYGELEEAGMYSKETALQENIINERAQFLGKVQRNASDVIQGIYFVQQ